MREIHSLYCTYLLDIILKPKVKFKKKVENIHVYLLLFMLIFYFVIIIKIFLLLS